MCDDEAIQLPTAWLSCPNHGNIVQDLFVPFKTILDKNFNSVVSLNRRWNVSSLSKLIKSHNLHLVVDLTNRSDFYDPRELKKVSYLKLFEDGFNGYPTEQHINKFAMYVDEMININPEARVGVHCDNGFNNTGFMIVSYLVKIKQMELENAVNLFAYARAPGIFISKYLAKLKHRYDREAVIISPVVPTWYSEIPEKKLTLRRRAKPSSMDTESLMSVQTVSCPNVKKKGKPKAIPTYVSREICATSEVPISEVPISEVPISEAPSKVTRKKNQSKLDNIPHTCPIVEHLVPEIETGTNITRKKNQSKLDNIPHTCPIVKHLIPEIDTGTNISVPISSCSPRKRKKSLDFEETKLTSSIPPDDVNTTEKIQNLCKIRKISSFRPPRFPKAAASPFQPKKVQPTRFHRNDTIQYFIRQKREIADYFKRNEESKLTPLTPITPITQNIKEAASCDTAQPDAFFPTLGIAELLKIKLSQNRMPSPIIDDIYSEIDIDSFGSSDSIFDTIGSPISKPEATIPDAHIPSSCSIIDADDANDVDLIEPMDAGSSSSGTEEISSDEKHADFFDADTTKPCTLESHERLSNVMEASEGSDEKELCELTKDESLSRSEADEEMSSDESESNWIEIPIVVPEPVDEERMLDPTLDIPLKEISSNKDDTELIRSLSEEGSKVNDEEDITQEDVVEDYQSAIDNTESIAEIPLAVESNVVEKRIEEEDDSDDSFMQVDNIRETVLAELAKDKATKEEVVPSKSSAALTCSDLPTDHRFIIDSTKIVSISDPKKLESLQEKFKKMMHTTLYGFIGSKYKLLTWKNYDEYVALKNKVFNTWTTNGRRCLLYLGTNDEVYLIDENNNYFAVSDLHMAHYSDPLKRLTESIFDGEFVIDRVKDKDHYIFLISNVYMIEGKYVDEIEFSKRIVTIETLTVLPRHNMPQHLKINEPFQIGLMKFLKLDNLKHVWENLRKVVPHKMTGITFYPFVSDGYAHLKATPIFYWQPAELKSIDFRMKRAYDNDKKVTVGELYLRGKNEAFSQIFDLTESELSKFDHKIVKCQFNFTSKKWYILEEQTFKKLPTAFSEIKDRLEDLINPVTFNELL